MVNMKWFSLLGIGMVSVVVGLVNDFVLKIRCVLWLGCSFRDGLILFVYMFVVLMMVCVDSVNDCWVCWLVNFIEVLVIFDVFM